MKAKHEKALRIAKLVWDMCGQNQKRYNYVVALALQMNNKERKTRQEPP